MDTANIPPHLFPYSSLVKKKKNKKTKNKKPILAEHVEIQNNTYPK